MILLIFQLNKDINKLFYRNRCLTEGIYVMATNLGSHLIDR